MGWICLQAGGMAEVAAAEHGKASWYSIRSNHGTVTASGQRLDDNQLTAAHKTLPMGTQVRVTNLHNNKSIECVITDRGPAIKDRVLDVTKRAAEILGFRDAGLTRVKIEVIGRVSLNRRVHLK